MISRGHRQSGGFSLLEILVALAILLAGIVAIINIFPLVLQTSQRAIHIREAGLLAQQKAEEIRRDWRAAPNHTLSQMRFITTPTDPVQSAQYPHLAYSFSGVSAYDTIDDPGDVRDNRFIPRIIIRYDTSFDPSGEILYELRFDQ